MFRQIFQEVVLCVKNVNHGPEVVSVKVCLFKYRGVFVEKSFLLVHYVSKKV